MRLPLDETITVWSEEGALRARHRMWIAGWCYADLDYRIARDGGSEVAAAG